MRFVSYLSPSLPESLFRAIAALVSPDATVRFITATSGPARGEVDPFSTGEADIGFLCAPTYSELAARPRPPVELLPAAFVFDDPRAAGRPVYFSEVVVARDAPARSFADLAGRTWVYNDVCSLSGYHSLLRKLRHIGATTAFLGELRQVGTHLAALDAVARGAADAAAIDSNVLALAARRDPTLLARLRVLETWGPFPIQPIVARATLPAAAKADVTRALLGCGDRLRAHGVVGFAAVRDADYAAA